MTEEVDMEEMTDMAEEILDIEVIEEEIEVTEGIEEIDQKDVLTAKKKDTLPETALNVIFI